MNQKQTFHTTNVVQQLRKEAAAINAAMNPAPAGKLTDEQLGEIGRSAVKAELPHSMISDWAISKGTGLFTFTRAVREAVEKEQAEEIARLSNDLNLFRWVPVSVRPTIKDGAYIEVSLKDGDVLRYKNADNFEFPRYGMFWRPFCPPPAPTAEQEMEAAYQASLKYTWMDVNQWNSKEAFAKGWYAAKAKEAK